MNFKRTNDYRTMINTVIGPILNYFGFVINENGIIQKIGDDFGITLSGKHLYVPENGEDYFTTRDSTVLTPFNPFRIREHALILAKFFCGALSDRFRDEDDPFEYNGDGEVIDIVKLVKRGPKNTDKLPATFNGVIYEIWCRDEDDVLGTGIDEEGNDIRAIIKAMLDTLSKHTHLVEQNINFDRVFRYVARVEAQKDAEAEMARSRYSTTISQTDLSSDTLANVEFEEPSKDEDEDAADYKDELEYDDKFQSAHDYDQYNNDIYDEMEYF